MLNSIIGTKVGMTQLFDKQGNVVPVTVVDINNWFVTQVKSAEKDGYAALQLGLVRKALRESTAFSPEWVKNKAASFTRIKEVPVTGDTALTVGHKMSVADVALQEGDLVSATGISTGKGFQGVVKRWGFGGGPKAHGSKFHRKPGSSGFLRRQGEVMKGKKFPGHMGADQRTVQGLTIVHIDRDKGCLFIKGALPGRKDTVILVNKQEK